MPTAHDDWDPAADAARISALINDKKLTEAERELVKLLGSVQEITGFWHCHFNMMLGRVWQAQGRLAEAESAFRYVTERDGNFHAGIQALAGLLVDIGKLLEAESLIRPVIQRVPRSSWAHFILGRVLLRSFFIEEGHAEIRRAIRLAPEVVQFRVELLKSLIAQNQRWPASRLASATHKLAPQNETVRRLQSEVLRTRTKPTISEILNEVGNFVLLCLVQVELWLHTTRERRKRKLAIAIEKARMSSVHDRSTKASDPSESDISKIRHLFTASDSRRNEQEHADFRRG